MIQHPNFQRKKWSVEPTPMIAYHILTPRLLFAKSRRFFVTISKFSNRKSSFCRFICTFARKSVLERAASQQFKQVWLRSACTVLAAISTTEKKIMTQLTVSIEDVSMLDQIRQAISLLRGVTSVTLKRQSKTGMDRAIDDIKHGRVYEASSVEDLINQCKAWSTRSDTPASSNARWNVA